MHIYIEMVIYIYYRLNATFISVFNILSCMGGALIKRWVLDWMNWIYGHLMRTTRNYRQLQCCRYFHTLQSTVTHIYTRTHDTYAHTHTSILSLHSYPGNGFQHSSCTSLTVTAAHMKSSLHSLILFLPSQF
jgi:hypothetical protein